MPMLQEANALHWSSLCPVNIFDQECPARRYLAFAIADINDGDSDRHLVNAVSNAKRALHLRIECLIDAYGGELLRKELATFPRRLEFCNRCGIVSPTVLRRLNAMRNDVEHDYLIPTREQTLDFVDIIDLFLEASSWLVHKFPEHLELASQAATYWFRIRCVPRSGLINVERMGSEPKHSLDLNIRDGEAYTSWMKLVLEKAKQVQIAAD
jgi:hypothetical protein